MNINNETLREQAVFVSSDLALAAVISLSFPIVVIDKQNPRKAVFVFNRSKYLTDLVDKYWNKELSVEPRAYFDQLKSLKARLYGNE